ncbi:hypothetical protein HOK51_09550 [Candidatus Woesearchaeota archaeon]|jgi:hypothetical protein|nr:hypothetical protein [Candidatus Woesearchaeota archaeon]MBT6520067.1 hypothetical protein [Candidatus Woesearchaeota archaeon]MBT7366672.1 hypothetical protein [Candidatus Woesearchaeota archaeon]
MKKIEDLISESFEIEKFKSVKITDQALQKILLYSNYTSKIAGNDIEVAGLLVAAENNFSTISTDAYLLTDQNVTGGDAQFGDNSISQAYKKAQLEHKKIIGMWHSHGNLNAFHSGYDDSHLEVLYLHNQNNLKNIIKTGFYEKIFESNGMFLFNDSEGFFEISQQNSQPKTIILDLSGNKEFKKIKKYLSNASVEIRMNSVRGLPFASSIVVNKRFYDPAIYNEQNNSNKNKYYCETLIQKSTRTKNPIKKKNLILEILPESLDRQILNSDDQQEILDNVLNQVKYNGTVLKNIFDKKWNSYESFFNYVETNNEVSVGAVGDKPEFEINSSKKRKKFSLKKLLGFAQSS